jgi:DNA-cytosine methyltransferase
MKVLSLFDGISVAQQALKSLGIDCDYYASEIDKYAIQLTQKNFPNTIQLGSVVGLKPDFQPDLLIGGSPCQDLSIAKKNREGLSGSRSGLFYEYVRILKETKPKYFVLENVNSMPKEAKETITKELFGIEPVMINAALVSAQNRKRLFWVGKLDDLGNYKQVKIDLPDDKGIILKSILENEVDDKFNLTESNIKTINRNFGAKGKVIFIENDLSVIEKMTYPSRINMVDGLKSPTLPAAMGTGGGNVPVIVLGGNDDFVVVPEATKAGYAIATEGQSIDLSFPNSKTRRGRVGDKVKNLMTSQNIGVFQNSIIRKLTPIECERLQSLPDNYTDGVSNSQRYKALGNAFNCEVIKHIINSLNLKGF